jgi:hypothetical protein
MLRIWSSVGCWTAWAHQSRFKFDPDVPTCIPVPVTMDQWILYQCDRLGSVSLISVIMAWYMDLHPGLHRFRMPGRHGAYRFHDGYLQFSSPTLLLMHEIWEMTSKIISFFLSYLLPSLVSPLLLFRSLYPYCFLNHFTLIAFPVPLPLLLFGSFHLYWFSSSFAFFAFWIISPILFFQSLYPYCFSSPFDLIAFWIISPQLIFQPLCPCCFLNHFTLVAFPTLLFVLLKSFSLHTSRKWGR